MQKCSIFLVPLVLVAILSLLAGCTAPGGNQTQNVTMTQTVTMTPTVTMTTTPPGEPQLMITAPTNGATVPDGNVQIAAQVMNFILIDKLGQPNVTGEGHLHYFKDVAIPAEPGKPAVTAPGTYIASANTTATWQNVTSGTHNFSVQLVNNDHTPLIPIVSKTVTVNVTGGSGTVTVDLVAKNFAFSPTTISVPAGAVVTMNFDNQDSSPHNFAVYRDSSASSPIFVGEIVTGKKVTYTFTAPSTPGTYFFRCDVHPSMTGSFIVT